MNFLEVLVTITIWFIMWMVLGANIAPDPETLANSPELRQCLSQSGTTWQWGECVININQK